MRWLCAVSLLFSASTAFGRDVVIPPLIEPPAAMSEESLLASIDRSPAIELAQLSVEGDAVRVLDAPLPLPVQETMPFEASARIAVEGADAFRLRFDGAAGTVLWVAGSDDSEFIRFEPATGEAWGPTTHGATVYVAAQGSTRELAITALAAVQKVTTQSGACLEDVACPTAAATFDEVMDASRAVAYVRFVRDGRAQVCSGALLSDAAQSRTPYLLTAQHCIDSAETAATVEIIWDLRSASCGSNQMAAYSRGYGAELLVASAETDVALLKLAALPPGRVFLGVDTRPLEAGTAVHRVSHAAGLSQTFAAGVVDPSARTCAGAPKSSFIYSKPTAGGIATGSSGAPLLVRGLYVAGQLRGLCGADPANPCAAYNEMVDGSIRESWPLLARYLDPATAPRKRRAAR
jgi:hypothetical protein